MSQLLKDPFPEEVSRDLVHGGRKRFRPGNRRSFPGLNYAELLFIILYSSLHWYQFLRSPSSRNMCDSVSSPRSREKFGSFAWSVLIIYLATTQVIIRFWAIIHGSYWLHGQHWSQDNLTIINAGSAGNGLAMRCFPHLPGSHQALLSTGGGSRWCQVYQVIRVGWYRRPHCFQKDGICWTRFKRVWHFRWCI